MPISAERIIDGKFARVFGGNGTWEWLPEGDDLQTRANANCDPYWLTAGRDCPIAERGVEGSAIVYVLSSGKLVYEVYVSREHANRALASFRAR